jgi:hypothetical protein
VDTGDASEGDWRRWRRARHSVGHDRVGGGVDVVDYFQQRRRRVAGGASDGRGFG